MGESTSGSKWISAAEFHRAPGVPAGMQVRARRPSSPRPPSSHAADLIAPVVAAAERFGILPDVDVRPGSRRTHPEPQPGGNLRGRRGVRCGRVASRRAADARSLARAVVGAYVAQHSQADVRPFFTAALGYEAFGDTDAVDPLLRAAARLQPDHRRLSGEVGRTSMSSCRPTRLGRGWMPHSPPEGRLVDDSHAPRLVVARVARQPRRGHRILDRHLRLTGRGAASVSAPRLCVGGTSDVGGKPQ